MGESRADLNTGGAGGAFISSPKNTFAGQTQGFFRAAINTFATAYTFFRKKENLRTKVYSLRIMAPSAGERATFEKDCRPDARAIM